MVEQRDDAREPNDVATTLMEVVEGAAADDATRLMLMYEATERSYRAAMMAGAPVTRVSAHTTG